MARYVILGTPYVVKTRMFNKAEQHIIELDKVFRQIAQLNVS